MQKKYHPPPKHSHFNKSLNVHNRPTKSTPLIGWTRKTNLMIVIIQTNYTLQSVTRQKCVAANPLANGRFALNSNIIYE